MQFLATMVLCRLDGMKEDLMGNIFEEMEQAKRYYYHLMGWDEKGVPMPEKLVELGIDQITGI